MHIPPKPPHDRSHLLTLEHPKYRKAVDKFFDFQFSGDGEDLTSDLFIQQETKISAKIISRENGILAGQEEILYLLQGLNIKDTWHFQDGEEFKGADEILTLSGDGKEILRIERTLLNTLSRMSGIATHTNRFSSQLPKSIYFAATRKTLWGMLDKKAVTLGGGLTHRLGLFDAVLVKENHLSLSDGIKNVVEKVSQQNTADFWEIEVETEDEFFTVLDTLEQFPSETPGVIMLDNFIPEDISHVLNKIDIQEWNGKNIFFEASGGISPKNFLGFADTGVNILSAGFLTKHAQSLDFSMKV